jgi:hypothetical protein
MMATRHAMDRRRIATTVNRRSSTISSNPTRLVDDLVEPDVTDASRRL